MPWDESGLYASQRILGMRGDHPFIKSHVTPRYRLLLQGWDAFLEQPERLRIA
jgi:hypothetical protein